MSSPKTSDKREDLERLLSPQRKVMAALLRSDVLTHGDVEAALSQLVEISARIMRVERASVWRFSLDYTSLECVELYINSTGKHGRGPVISSSTVPHYVTALTQERSIAVEDAQRDVRTAEFAKDYLLPNGIMSLLDAPILFRGEVVGVVCHEHVGENRQWQVWEELVAATFADYIAMVLGAAEHITQQRELVQYHSQLKTQVADRTRQLEHSEQNFRMLFSACPVPLVLSKLADDTVIAANTRAAQLFGVLDDEVQLQHAPDYWTSPDDRQTMITMLRQSGMIEGFEARLKGAQGRVFWGELAARVLNFDSEKALLVGIHDITSHKLAESALETSRRTLQTLFDAAPMPLLLVSMAGHQVRFCNGLLTEWLDTQLSTLFNTQAQHLFASSSDWKQLLETLNREGHVEGLTLRLKSVKGLELWALVNARTLDIEGEPFLMVGFADVTEQKHTEERLRQLATTDSLTGILNRRRFFEIADEEIERSKRYKRPLTMAMLDADHFKKVNDRFGHLVGDRALQHIARSIEANLRNADDVGRYGGEEFAVLLPETSVQAARAVMERVRAAIAAESIAVGDEEFRLTVSVGIVSHREGESVFDTLKRADDALYLAKSRGRNRVEIIE